MLALRRYSRPVVRPLKADKAEACAQLHAASFAHAWGVEEMAALIVSPSMVAAGALDPADGHLRGFVLARIAADEAEILTIAVEAAWRSKGVGGMLLDEAIRRAANGGAKAMFLEVGDDNQAALALYRRRGFVRAGERAGYYRRPDGGRATAAVMRRSLL